VVNLSDGTQGTAMVPSGASTGKHEAVELRDTKEARYQGKGVQAAISNVENKIGPIIVGLNPDDQQGLDEKLLALDGTANKSNLGANSILGVSLAVARAAAVSKNIPLYQLLGKDIPSLLPIPLFNIFNGGRHAEDSTDFQEFMVVPTGAPTFSEAVRAGAEIYQSLRKILSSEGLATTVGDEGGFAPSVKNNRAALELVNSAIGLSGYSPGKEVGIALDAAASELYNEGQYTFSREERTLSPEELVDYYSELINEFPIISIEDGMAEDDWDGWCLLTEKIGSDVQIVGDDLYATNKLRINRGINVKASNAVLIKPNQIGTLTETLDAVAITKKAGWNAIISHRSGETEDTTISDLAVATSSGQIKAGAPCRSERLAKYNRLLEIQAQLGELGTYAGLSMKSKRTY
jgi:enolase